MKIQFYSAVICLGMGTPALALIGEVLDTAGDIAKGATDTAGDIAKGATDTAANIVEPRRREVIVEREVQPVIVEKKEQPKEGGRLAKDEEDELLIDINEGS